MGYQSVRYRKQLEVRGERGQPLSIAEGVARVKQMAAINSDRSYRNGRKRKEHDQTVRLVLNLGIDARQADQALRGAISLPRGIGKSRRVIAFCDAATAEGAKQAGAADAGADELIEKIQGGWLDFDVAVAHPSMMGKVGKLGRVLGPQGKMPTPKSGTVTPDVVTAVKEFSGGRIEFRNDEGGNVHLPVGKVSFPDEHLVENVQAVLDHMLKIKPAASKGQYIRRICLSAVMTPSVTLATGL